MVTTRIPDKDYVESGEPSSSGEQDGPFLDRNEIWRVFASQMMENYGAGRRGHAGTKSYLNLQVPSVLRADEWDHILEKPGMMCTELLVACV